MKRLALFSVAALLVLAATPAQAQYEPSQNPTPKDVYCSGFLARTELPNDLRIIMAGDAVGRMIYSHNDYVYLSRGQNGGVTAGERYLIVRRSTDPNPAAREYRGPVYEDIGRVEVKYVHPTTSTALVVHACDGIQPGDVLIPFQERPAPAYKPSGSFDRFAPPTGQAEGEILHGKDYAVTYGAGDAIYVDVGSGNGVKVGDYLTLYRAGRGTRNKLYRHMGRGFPRSNRGIPYAYKLAKPRSDLPREVLGEAFVLRVDQDAATAVVTTSLSEIHAGDFVEKAPPPPGQAALEADPASITRGQSASLTWDAWGDEITLEPGIGPVDRRGTLEVRPTENTTYTLTASAEGGAAQATATVTVIAPPPPPPPPTPPPPAPGPTLEDLFARSVSDTFFAFNSAELTEEAQATLQRAVDFLRTNPGVRILIEGHCDEIGTDQYNLELGQRRAVAVRDYLVSLGASAGQLEPVSRGRTRQFCAESSEEPCRALNRRAHFILVQ
ncbi:MAG: OmpA family protein [Terriglobia bacterium]